MSNYIDKTKLDLSGNNPIVFCFHYAGGNARVFSDWSKCRLVNFVPIELPGHGRRIREKLQNNIFVLSREIAEEISVLMKKQHSGRKLSLFGHSLGAIMAFNVACTLIKNYGLSPACLQVAGRHAPQDEDPSEYRTSMGMDILAEELGRLGHTPAELLGNADFRDFFMPVIYSDYQISESYRYNDQKLSVPIFAYCGNGDTEANEEEMKHWAFVTSGKFRLKSYEGDHFFIFNDKEAFSNIISYDTLKSCDYGAVKFTRSNGNNPYKYERGTI